MTTDRNRTRARMLPARPGRPATRGQLRAWQSRRGASGLSYGLIVGLIAVVAIAATTQLGDEVRRLFGAVGGDLTEAGGGEVAGENAAPTGLSVTGSGTLAEGTDTSSGTTVASLAVADDGRGNNVLSVTGGADSGVFSISGTNLIFKDGTPDFEVPDDSDGDNIYEVELAVDDPEVGGNPDATASFALEITDDQAENCPDPALDPQDIGCQAADGAFFAGVQPNNGHRLFMAPTDEANTDLGFLAWNEGQNLFTDTSNERFEGLKNTNVLVNPETGDDPTNTVEDDFGPHPAAAACAEKSGANWYLPTDKEFETAWLNLLDTGNSGLNNTLSPGEQDVAETTYKFDLTGSQGLGEYWTSVQSSSDSAEAAEYRILEGNFSFGESKTTTHSVRCFRTPNTPPTGLARNNPSGTPPAGVDYTGSGTVVDIDEGTDSSGGIVVAELEPVGEGQGTHIFSVESGLDSAAFSINANDELIFSDGELDFEIPTDDNGDAIYKVTLALDDPGVGATPDVSGQFFTVNVIDDSSDNCPANPAVPGDLECQASSDGAIFVGEEGGDDLFMTATDEANTDLGFLQWNEGQDIDINAQVSISGKDGRVNTDILVDPNTGDDPSGTNQDDFGPHPAAAACASRPGPGDWYLPTPLEFEIMWENVLNTAGPSGFDVTLSAAEQAAGEAKFGFDFTGADGPGSYWTSRPSSSPQTAFEYRMVENTFSSGADRDTGNSVRCFRR